MARTAEHKSGQSLVDGEERQGNTVEKQTRQDNTVEKNFQLVDRQG